MNRNPLNDRDVDGNTMAWLANIDKEIKCLCNRCECEVREDQDYCDRCKDLLIN